MKNTTFIIIALILTLIIALAAVFLTKQPAESSSKNKSSSETSSVILETNEIKIVGNTVVHEFYHYGDTTTIVFTYKDGRLDNANFTRVCRDKNSANTIYDTFTGLNKHATSPMYEDIKLDGLTFTCKYTDFIMQDYKNLSQEELKEYLENESLLP